MDRTSRSLAAALALLLGALGASARAEPEPPGPAPHDIEVFRGTRVSVERGTLRDPAFPEERGVLGTRGARPGPAPEAPTPLEALGGPARTRLAAELAALGRVYDELLGLHAGPRLAARLTALESGEALRLPHRHARSRAGATPGRALSERTRHEASHAWVHALAPEAPAWLDEGLACVFESLEVGRSGEIRAGVNTRRHATLRSAARTGELPALASLLEQPRADLPDPDAAASWSVAFALLQTPAARETLRALLRGASPRDAAPRLATLGIEDPAALPRSWRRGASGAVASVRLIPAAAPALEAESERTSDAARPERRYRRAGALRCATGAIGSGPDARGALFCTPGPAPSAR